ncbi:MAG: polysaccharide deacetylase family protein, partial [Stellaceae bacterium]
MARWSDLSHELDRWGDEGRIATLWWRDDDAAAPGGRLDRLLEIAGTVPVALAVIPAAAELGLAARLGAPAARSGAAPPIAVLQHGWSHANHANRAAGAKKSEFSAARSDASV